MKKQSSNIFKREEIIITNKIRTLITQLNKKISHTERITFFRKFISRKI